MTEVNVVRYNAILKQLIMGVATPTAEAKTKKVFLGGTCNNSQWREDLKRQLKIDYFDPVVPNWNEAAYQKELLERENSNFNLYVITPKMKGVYSIAEVVDDSHLRPEKTIFCYLKNDGDARFDDEQLKSLNKTGEMIVRNGAKAFSSLEELAKYLNSQA